ncbi:uncharacterized protein LOC123564726 [Mercenaria mercenaria]|uniref:uncharacterized protein LOC123564726 n=1 Tax=Mercenaria mercenaria TaxID=6596 RepID=UPI001E1D3F67|nr:uncharacterized protein LOC123564726 [Mercenaria mercenaria]
MLQVSLNEVTDEEALQEENNIDSLDGYNGSIGDITTGQLFEVNNEAVRNEEQNNRNRNEFVEYLWYAATTVDLGDPATGRISPIRDEDLSR